MQLDHQKSSNPISAAATYLTAQINGHLATGQSVLWLVSGGSNVATATAVAKGLSSQSSQNLTVMLVDERYGAAGHPDSNWQQLLQAGFYIPGAILIPTLMGANFSSTTTDFNQAIDHWLTKTYYAFGLFGLGPDGHTAGILPGSPAISSLQAAIGYKATDLTRITITGATIARLDEVVLVANDDSKQAQLAKLSQNIAPEIQPAQLLKSAHKFIIFSK